MPTKADIIELAKQCYDPEIPVNIWDLGLIYDIELGDDNLKILMTLTSQACPSAQEIPNTFKRKIEDNFKLKSIDIQITFDPLWTPERITDEGKKKLGIDV